MKSGQNSGLPGASAARVDHAPTNAPASTDGPRTRLFLDGRFVAATRNVHRVIAPCVKHEGGPLLLDGRRVWTENNLSVSLYYDEVAGEYRGWRQENRRVTAGANQRWQSATMPIRSKDGVEWQTAGPAGESGIIAIMRDDLDSDPARRFKAVYTEADERAMRAACSPDGATWPERHLIVTNTQYSLAESTGDAMDRWWRPGAPGWSGGDSFPCVIYAPEQKKYVAFFRTNIDRRTSLDAGPMRRERAVGRSESSDFIHWSPHELALRADVTWQRTVGRGQQDYYQLQVWRCAGAYLGVLSVFYWQPDLVRLELAWSPDTIHWERICPGTDFIPQGGAAGPDWGCNFAAMRPIEHGDEVRVYYGGAAGRHNADSLRPSALCLATFRRDRFAGLAPSFSAAEGEILTTPLPVEGNRLRLNVNASGGEVRVELLDSVGRPIPGFTLGESDPIIEDSLGALCTWRGRDSLQALRGTPICLRLVVRQATAYAASWETSGGMVSETAAAAER